MRAHVVDDAAVNTCSLLPAERNGGWRSQNGGSRGWRAGVWSRVWYAGCCRGASAGEACSFCTTRSWCVHIDWLTVCWGFCANQWWICSRLNTSFQCPLMYQTLTLLCSQMNLSRPVVGNLVLIIPLTLSSFAHDISRLKHSYFNSLLDQGFSTTFLEPTLHILTLISDPINELLPWISVFDWGEWQNVQCWGSRDVLGNPCDRLLVWRLLVWTFMLKNVNPGSFLMLGNLVYTFSCIDFMAPKTFGRGNALTSLSRRNTLLSRTEWQKSCVWLELMVETVNNGIS